MNTSTTAATLSLACLLAPGVHAISPDCPVVRLSGPVGLAQTFGLDMLMLNDRHLIVGDKAALSLCPGGTPLGCGAGAVFAFEPGLGGWMLRQTIIPPDIQFNDSFGRGKILYQQNPDRLVTMSNRFDGERMGMGHVYEHDGEEWREVSRFLAPDGQPLSPFGTRSALYDDTLLISQSSRVHRYREVDGQWQHQDTTRQPDFISTSHPSGFGGGGLSLDGHWAFIGAVVDSTHGTQHGSVIAYRRGVDGSLAFAQYLLPPADASGRVPNSEWFGSDLGFDGRTLVVGAVQASRDFENQGVAYVYELDGDAWTLRQELRSSQPGTRPGHREQFGFGISLDGDTLIIGYAHPEAPLARAHLFRRGADGLWREAALLRPGSAAPTHPWGFGRNSTLHGRWAVISASGEGTTGAAYIFDLECILSACKPDLDRDSILTIFDFFEFQNLFAAGDLRADFDGDGELTLFDFLAFQTAFAEGCE